jgi:glycosyltransferase involved in cell wall biosynthesis
MAQILALGDCNMSTDVGDMKAILPSEYVVEVGDETELSEKIRTVQKHYADVLGIYQTSFAKAKKYFTLDVMVHEILKIYKEVVSG